MKKFFIQEQRENETNLIRDINNTATTLKELVDYIQLTNKDKEDELKEIIKTFIIKNKSPISFEFKSNCVHLSPALSILIEVH